MTSTKISDKSQIPAGDLYNSDYIRRIKVSDTTKPITITYKNVAKDKESGKSLDVTLTLSDFVTDKIDTQGSSADANPRKSAFTSTQTMPILYHNLMWLQ